MTRDDLARMIDHTLLRPEATPADVVALCEEGARLGVGAVCVSPSMVAEATAAGSLRVATVVGFPSGAHRPEVKAFEAAGAVDEGAAEIDMVVDLGRVLAGDWRTVTYEIAHVRDWVPAPVVLKVILESALLDDEHLVAACRAAVDAGADFVKTSTGFHPSGGATEHAVGLMAGTVGGRVGVKASGGIRTTTQALAMVAAGATRLGTSSSAVILEGVA